MSDDDLTTAYMVGFHKRDDEVAALKAEIERLRGAYEQERQDCINLTEKVIPNLRVEVERLRALLREGLRPWPLAVSDGDGSNMRPWRDDWERRVTMTLSDAPDQRD